LSLKYFKIWVDWLVKMFFFYFKIFHGTNAGIIDIRFA